MAGEFQAGAVVGKMTLDRTQWNAAVKGVKAQTKSMGSWVKQNSAQFKKLGMAIAATGAIAAATFTKMVKKYMETGDWIDKMSKRTGFSAKALSELAYAADITGASLSDVEKSTKRMARSIFEANEGLESYQRAFRLIGIDVKTLMGMKPEEQFMTIGSAIAGLKDETEKAATAQMIFGRAGTTLLPFFKEGREGLERLRKEAHRLGIVFDEAGAARAADFKDSLTALKGAFTGLGHAIVKDIVPVLTRMAKHFTDVFVNVQDNTATFTEGILGFFKILVQGIGGLMMAWTGLKAGVFKVSAYVAGQLEKFAYAIVTQLAVLEKIPIVGKKIVPITDAMWESLKALTAIAKGYNEEGEKQIDIVTNQATFLENLMKALDDVKTKLKELATESAITSEEIGKTMLPATENIGDKLMKLGETSEKVTEWSDENLKRITENQIELLQNWAATLQGGLAGVLNAIKQIVIAKFIEALAEAKMPFLMKLGLLGLTVGLLETTFASFMKGAKKRALGGPVREGEAYEVGERGRELFVPERPGTIISHREFPLAQPSVNVTIAPVIQVSDQVDPYTAQRLARNIFIPEVISAFNDKYLLEDMRRALKIK